MTELLLALALAATAAPGFPREAGGRIAQQALGVTIGGAPAIVVPAGERVVGLRGDGSAVPGFPFALGQGATASGPAAAADMDGDGRPEIAVATTAGRVFLWSGGAIARGFPVSLGARARAGASFADVDGDGRPELLIGDELGRVHALQRTGREAVGWPAIVGAPVTSAISSSAFGGVRVLAFGCEDGKVHVLDLARRERPGFPLVTSFSVTGAPVFADVDDDGDMDLVATSQDFGVYAVGSDGQPLRGFPVRAEYRIYEGAAVADLDGDRRLDIVFASADGNVHAVNGSGEPLPGFPVHVGVRVFSGPAIGDVDRDGSPDVVVVTSDGMVTALSARGKPLAGFPTAVAGADVGASPLLYDSAGDGTLRVFVGLPSGALHAVRGESIGTARAAVPWPAPGRDAAHTGRYGPNAPAYKQLHISPSVPRAHDVVRAHWRPVWLDARPGDVVPAPRIEWLKDGKPVAALDGKKELAAGTVRRGERWQFVLSSALGRWESPEVFSNDTAPGEPAVALEPAVPSRAADVRAVVRTPAVDPDGDPVRYDFAWLVDGLDAGVQGDTFPASLLRKGALLTARVIASDGRLAGPAARAQARIADTPPDAPRLALEPEAPGRIDELRVRLEAPASDLDGDALVYHHRWTVDGQPRNVPLSSGVLPGALFRKHQRIEVEVRAYDGQLEGPPVRAAVTARNTPPAAPRVEIRPPHPRRGEALRASIVAPAEDVDGDPVTYRFEWKKNGEPFRGTVADGREIPGAAVARGDAFELVVTPSDGEASGAPAIAAVRVLNTPPVPPRIAISPARPQGGEPLTLEILEPARDADGDAVSLQIAWTRDAQATGSGEAVLAPAQFRKHERVRVTVTPRDAEEAGEPAAAEVVVDDAAPTAPAIAFAAVRPTVAESLRAVVKAPAADADGDVLRYEYRWLRDGAPFALPDGTAASRTAPFWTSASEVPQGELRKGQRWTVEARAHDGERPGPTVRAAVTIVNIPPPPPRVAFVPDRPRRVDGIAVSVDQPRDADGDVVTYRYTWTRDGQRFDAPPHQAQIPRGVARKGERWAVEVVANDGEADSAAVRREVVVTDTAPGPVAIALCDGPVASGTVPQARIVAAAQDADGDAVTYRHEWTLNGKALAAMQGQTSLTAPPLRKHDRVQVVVTPWDGELAGPPATGECEVENTPPAAPVATLEPAEPTAAAGVSVAIRKPSRDRDGDDVTYRYAWFRNGVRTAHDKPALAPGAIRHGETWRVEVTPFDGEVAGDPVALSAVVRNTPPPAPTVALVPATATTGERVACEARAPERDADQEPIAIAYRWFRNDGPVAMAEGSATLPARLVRRGERWRCEAWTSDATADSPHVAAELTVRNSAPSAPVAAIEPDLPRRGDDLLCRVAVPSVDLDGDPVSYAYAWTRNGKPVQAGAEPARIDGARIARGERWRCSVTPSDGTLAGTAGAAEKTVENTPPRTVVVRLQPAAPRPGERLRCEVVSKAEDPDGDKVRYRFAWQRNGLIQSFADTSQDVPSRLVQAGDRWRCIATPTDGLEDGSPAATEEVRVAVPEVGAAPLSQGPGDRPLN
jgi:hypothetical protein